MSLMSWAERLRSVVAGDAAPGEQRAITSWDDWLTGGSKTYSGKNVTVDNATQMVTVWACISLISDSIASAKPETFTERDTTLVKRRNPAWVDEPSSDMSRPEFFGASTVSALTDGNAFWYITRGRTGAVSELILLDPTVVDVEYDPRTGRRVYRVNGEFVPADFIKHIPGLVMPGSARALSPIGAASQAIGLGMAAEEFGAKFFANSATMSGVIEVPGTMEKDQAKVMAQSFSTDHQGLKKSHLPGVLTGGAKWQPITVTPEHAQFLETRKFQTAEIARLYRVPPHLVGDVERSTSWGTGIEEQNRNFIQYTLSPWTTRFETAMSSLLPRPQEVKFNMNNLLRGTKRERYETYNVGVTGGFLLPDEARQEEGLEPLPDGAGAVPRPAPNASPDSVTPTEQGGSDESQ